uniref:NADH-ubiquinone oxidoreductase chain 2 n=1 Tax=Ventidius harrisoni TaxID=3095940 RepID=A0AB38Z6S6_9HEMI|nr:NADH dehydrogenase subunit 2 [Ventidius harrisoni]WPW47139.1 NADH dehydrogenase subunit 2 [Ventidius harrisoni]WPW47152.1 NADH dehydrogenase subunit 2 [Ventidius harrisoni]
MIKNSTKMMMMVTLILSTIMVLSSENWFSMWMGLEINMMSFIPMLEKDKNFLSSESKMIYFIIQSMASMLFMFTLTMNPSMIMKENIVSDLPIIMITLAMITKMGMAPMHLWFINIISKISWMNCMMIMTWQKIAPLFVLSNMNGNSKIMMILSLISAMVGAIGGINQVSIKKMLAYSSINHLGWMTICLDKDNEMWMKYLIIYSIMIIMLTLSMQMNSINFINQMNINMKSKMEKTNFLIMMLSLGGLPPFIGFLPKWLVIQSLMQTNSMLTLFIILMSSMITLFYYLRMITPIIMMNNITNKWNMNKYSMKNKNMIMFIINMMLPITLIINMM